LLVQGSGVAKTERREVPSFTEVESSGSATVTIQVGQPPSLVIEADDNLLPLIEATVEGHRLRIGSRSPYTTRAGVKVTITVPELDAVRVSGSSDLTATGITAKDFDTELSGSGKVRLSGKVDALNASVTGSGTLDTTALSARAAQALISGSGHIRVSASESLKARVTGSGSIRYSGSPQVQTKITGSGKVQAL
jgi:hypothetical protein